MTKSDIRDSGVNLKIFVFGRLGSGKSTASKHILSYAADLGLPGIRFEDSPILYSLFLQNQESPFFQPILKGDKLVSFNVANPAIYDQVSKIFEQEVNQKIRNVKNSLLLIEFARPDYEHAFKQFTDEFLHGAYFIFIDAKGDDCVQRIKKRFLITDRVVVTDDHFISAHNVKIMFGNDNLSYISSKFKIDYGILDEKVKVIMNNDTLSEFKNVLEGFVHPILSNYLEKVNSEGNLLNH